MVLYDIQIGTLYGFLRDIKPYVDNIRIFLEHNSETGMYRFRVILNEWHVDKLDLISKPYANRQYIYELMQDIRILYNLKIRRNEKD